LALRRILIDTNAYAAFKRGHSGTLDVVRHAPEIALNATVLGELLAGFASGSHAARNRRELAEFLHSPRVRQLAVDADTAEHYATVFGGLRKKGRPVPANDLWIAASALQYGYAVFSFDKHFADIENLLVGNSLEDFLP
jgi:predicted nucleic acid-binding protein